MSLDLKMLSVFVKVAELQSFVRAAEALGITQSGASGAVKRLEAQLGVTLLARTTRSVRLTLDGEAFFHRCKQVLADLDDAQRVLTRTRSQPSGMLRVSIPVSFGRVKVIPQLGNFQAKYPKVQISVSITDRYVNLVDEGIDVAVRFGPLEDSNLVAATLAALPRRVLAAPSYLKKFGVPRELAELERHNCLPLTYHETGRVRSWRFGTGAQARKFQPRGSMSFNDGHALYAAVKAGFGLGQIHDYYVQADVANGDLIPVLQEHEPEPDIISVVYPKARHLSPKVRAFADFMKAACRQPSITSGP